MKTLMSAVKCMFPKCFFKIQDIWLVHQAIPIPLIKNLKFKDPFNVKSIWFDFLRLAGDLKLRANRERGTYIFIYCSFPHLSGLCGCVLTLVFWKYFLWTQLAKLYLRLHIYLLSTSVVYHCTYLCLLSTHHGWILPIRFNLPDYTFELKLLILLFHCMVLCHDFGDGLKWCFFSCRCQTAALYSAPELMEMKFLISRIFCGKSVFVKLFCNLFKMTATVQCCWRWYVFKHMFSIMVNIQTWHQHVWLVVMDSWLIWKTKTVLIKNKSRTI